MAEMRKIKAIVDVPLSLEEAETYIGKQMKVTSQNHIDTTGVVTAAFQRDGIVWMEVEVQVDIQVIPVG